MGHGDRWHTADDVHGTATPAARF